MEIKTSYQAPININVLIQNYINVHTSKDDSSFYNFPSDQKFRNDSFPREYAKPHDFEPKAKQALSPLALHCESPIKEQELDEIDYFSTASADSRSQHYEERHMAPDGHLMEIVGFFLIGFAALLFILVIYAIVFSPIVGNAGHIILDFIRKDNYYCMLAPLMMPVTSLMIYLNWVSVKFFRHS